MTYRSILIVCLATLGLAVAGWGQADGRIAFLSDREGYIDVWIMNADGSDPVNLTQGQYCSSPVWSPDGTKIAYIDVGTHNSGRGIWMIDAAGNPQQLTDDIESIGPNSADDLFWSEDGSSIYYHVWNRSEMFAVAPDGSGSSLMEWREAALILRRFWDDHRYLSPDGTKRALVGVLRGDEEDQALFIMTSEDTLMTSEDRVTAIPLSGQPNVDLFFRDLGDSWATTGFPLTWAPNSMRVAFTSYTILNITGTSYSFLPSTGEIWAVDIDGSNLVELTNGLGGYSPVWQPVSPSATATSVEAQSWGRIKALLSTGAR